MAILGKIDALALTDTVSVAAAVGPETRSVVTLDAETPAGNNFNGTGDNAVDQGDLLLIGGVSYYVEAVTSDTTLLIHTDGGVQAAVAATRRTAPKEVAEYFAKGGDSANYQLLGVDLTEAQDQGSRSRGINTPGWWLYRTYTDVSGETRHKAECIAAFKVDGPIEQTGSASTVNMVGDAADDTTVGEVGAIISIVQPPAGVAVPVNTDATISVAGTTVTSGSLIFQWQRKPVGGRFANISDNPGDYAGTTTDTLIVEQVTAENVGDLYRVKITSDSGATEVVSSTTTLNLS